MSFYEFIEKLQRKPESSRRKILVVVSILLTTVILLLWLSIVTLDFGGNKAVLEQETSLGTFIDTISIGFTEISKSVTSFKEGIIPEINYAR